MFGSCSLSLPQCNSLFLFAHIHFVSRFSVWCVIRHKTYQIVFSTHLLSPRVYLPSHMYAYEKRECFVKFGLVFVQQHWILTRCAVTHLLSISDVSIWQTLHMRSNHVVHTQLCFVVNGFHSYTCTKIQTHTHTYRTKHVVRIHDTLCALILSGWSSLFWFKFKWIKHTTNDSMRRFKSFTFYVCVRVSVDQFPLRIVSV